jgi:hypothetical protein
MRSVLWIFPLVLFGVGCAAATERPDETSLSTAGQSASPAGFEAWLAEQCPNGATVNAAGRDGVSVFVVTCEVAREEALADPVARDRLLHAYLAQTEEAMVGEAVGEAHQPLTPAGLICGVLMTGISAGFNWPWGHEGCNAPRAERPDACKVATFGVPTVAAILCTIFL